MMMKMEEYLKKIKEAKDDDKKILAILQDINNIAHECGYDDGYEIGMSGNE